MQTRQLHLYFLILGLMTSVVIVAMGGGLFGQQEPWFLQWQHVAFTNLCHQIPKRSFWIKGQPMAVCSRCFGIYSGFLLGWIALPAISFTNVKRAFSSKHALIAACLLNIIDVVGNLLGFWENTLISRLVLGWFLGGTAAYLFSGSFFINKTKIKKEIYYGRVTTSE